MRHLVVRCLFANGQLGMIIKNFKMLIYMIVPSEGNSNLFYDCSKISFVVCRINNYICYTQYMVTSLYVVTLSIERFTVIASIYMVTDNSVLLRWARG